MVANIDMSKFNDKLHSKFIWINQIARVIIYIGNSTYQTILYSPDTYTS